MRCSFQKLRHRGAFLAWLLQLYPSASSAAFRCAAAACRPGCIPPLLELRRSAAEDGRVFVSAVEALEVAAERAAELMVELMAVGLAAHFSPKLEMYFRFDIAHPLCGSRLLSCDNYLLIRTRNVNLTQVRTLMLRGISAHRAIALPWLDDRPSKRIV